jgi:putative acetyltransferase
MIVRAEMQGDAPAIRRIHIEAFADHPFSHQTEHLIVDALREARALDLSFVAEDEGEVIGHVAFSSAVIGEAESGWMLLGPVGVLPERQGEGIGTALIESGLDLLRDRGTLGVVLVGDPGYYVRFGFRRCPGVTHAGVPDEYVLCLPFREELPTGEVIAHPAFSVQA